MLKFLTRKTLIVLLLAAAAISLAALCACSADKHVVTFSWNEVNLDTQEGGFPDIYVDGKLEVFSDFLFTDENDYVYVFNDKVYMQKGAPHAFETTINVVHKDDPTIKGSVKVVKRKVVLEEIEIELDPHVFAGEWVDFKPTAVPSYASLEEYEVTFDKPEYIETVEKERFKLTANAREAESITFTVTDPSGVSASAEIKLDYNVYEIETASELARLYNDPKGYFILKNDIDASVIENWRPIKEFDGMLSGNGKTVRNINFTLDESSTDVASRLGFIRQLTGVIKNVDFENITFSVRKTFGVSGTLYVGGVVGYMAGGVIENVNVSGMELDVEYIRTAKTNGSTMNVYVGGVVGFMESGSVSGADVSGSRIMGKGLFSQTSVTVNVYSGAIAGRCSAGGISDSSRTEDTLVLALVQAKKSSKLKTYAGGIAGYLGGGATISDCVSPDTENIRSVSDVSPSVTLNSNNNYRGALYGNSNN